MLDCRPEGDGGVGDEYCCGSAAGSQILRPLSPRELVQGSCAAVDQGSVRRGSMLQARRSFPEAGEASCAAQSAGSRSFREGSSRVAAGAGAGADRGRGQHIQRRYQPITELIGPAGD